MVIRYTELDPAMSGAKDFITRQRAPTLWQIFTLFITVFLLSISISVSVADRLMLSALMLMLLATTGAYAMVQIQRNRDQLLATEFQNALFASALGINHRFCLILRLDGNIVYFDRAFQAMFPDFVRQPVRTAEIFLNTAMAAPDQQALILSAIAQDRFAKTILTLHDVNHHAAKVVLSVEPLIRPSGFILLRARDYVEKRSGELLPQSATPSSPSLSALTLFSPLFAHVMDSMDVGVYITGPSGNIVYANPRLEEWLDYAQGGITEAHLPLDELFLHNKQRGLPIEPADYHGHVKLRKQNGEAFAALITQKIIHDAGAVIGCTGLVQLPHTSLNESTEKNW